MNKKTTYQIGVIFPLTNNDLINLFSKKFGISAVLSEILVSRGVSTIQEADMFLSGTYKDLHDPFLFRDMEPICKRLEEAILKQEKIIVYGDFDSDGVTATALLVHLFRNLNANVSWYIPDRFGEGHGISPQGVDWIIKQGGKIVITVDCGIANKDQIIELVNVGIDVIITDHHHIENNNIPVSCLILHPSLGEYPFPHLSGAGMALKLAQGVLKTFKYNIEALCKYIDLAAIGIVADVAPLLGENRIIVKEGLKQIENKMRPSLKALLNCMIENNKNFMRSTTTWSARDVAFLIAPRINAAGRLEKASWALSLLLEQDEEMILFHARRLEQLNKERQEIEEEILGEINRLLDENPSLLDEPALILNAPHWHFGIIGIIASRLANRYNIPVFLSCKVNGQIKGSARAPKGFSIVEALDKCSVFLLRHGGHDEAGGFTMEQEQYPAFKKALLEHARSNPLPLAASSTSQPIILDLRDATPELVKELAKLEPFGQGNPIPLFSSNNVILHRQRLVGKTNSHLLLSLYQTGVTKKGFLYNWQEKFPLPTGRYNAIYQLAFDHWQAGRNPSNPAPIVLYLSQISQIFSRQDKEATAPVTDSKQFLPDTKSLTSPKVIFWVNPNNNNNLLATTYFFVDQRFLKTKNKYAFNLLAKNDSLMIIETPNDLNCFIKESIDFPLHVSLPVYNNELVFHPLPEEDFRFEKFDIRKEDKYVEHLLLWFMPTDWDEMKQILAKGQKNCTVKVHLLFSLEHLNEKRAVVQGTQKAKNFEHIEKLLFKDKILRTGGTNFGYNQ